MKKIIIFIMITLMFITLFSETITEGFNSTGWGSSYGNYTVNGWSLVNVYRETSNKYEGVAAIRFNTSGSVRSIVCPERANGIGTLTLWHRRWSSSDGNQTFNIYKSTDGTSWDLQLVHSHLLLIHIRAIV
ncbi:MAG: hypothetical protein KA886_01380 [Candidatus Cloacimonetes bacterium]|nr:hypothetical protein [Candidatus Cloacimonadota bacterium]